MVIWRCGVHVVHMLIDASKVWHGGADTASRAPEIFPRLNSDEPIMTLLEYRIESIIHNYRIGYYHTYQRLSKQEIISYHPSLSHSSW